VKFVRKVENFFEKYIEGFFNKEFASGLQPVEIAKHLIRDMEGQKTVGVAHIYVPNEYTVFLNANDYQLLSSYAGSITQELSDYLSNEAQNRGYTIPGNPIVKLVKDEKLTKARFTITSRFTEVPVSQPAGEAGEKQDAGHTQIFDKASLVTLEQPRRILSARLRVIEGNDAGLELEIGRQRINIGRRESNELQLTDLNTSRLHAYLIFEGDCHVLHDAKSLNGTYVNGHRVTRKQLHNGDRIKVGNTVIAYEVR
jgi:hypothetical protein